MATLSAAGGAPGLTVSVADLLMPNHVAVIVTEVWVVTDVVATLNGEVDLFALTVVSLGTLATDGLLLVSWTFAPWVMLPVKHTTPVEFDPPVTLVGLRVTELSVGPAGAGSLTIMFAVRGTLSTAAMIWTGVSGTVALVVMVVVVSCTPAGTTTLGGDCAASGWSLKSRTVVGTTSAKAIEMVSVAEAPLLTMPGEIVMKLSPLAEATPGAANSPPVATSVASTAIRRIEASLQGGAHRTVRRGAVVVNRPLVVR